MLTISNQIYPHGRLGEVGRATDLRFQDIPKVPESIVSMRPEPFRNWLCPTEFGWRQTPSPQGVRLASVADLRNEITAREYLESRQRGVITESAAELTGERACTGWDL
jgi:hypothetical protein